MDIFSRKVYSIGLDLYEFLSWIFKWRIVLAEEGNITSMVLLDLVFVFVFVLFLA